MASSLSGEVQAFSLTSPVRILLLGRSGSGKSSSGNSILGTKLFKTKRKGKQGTKGQGTKECESSTAETSGRQVCVIDTPDLLDPGLSDEEVTRNRENIISLSKPGLHAFLLVMPIEEDTLANEQELLEVMRQMFGEGALAYTIVLFTRGGELEEESIEDYIQSQGEELKQLVQECKGGVHVLDNKGCETSSQVSDLLNKIDAMVKENGENLCIVRTRRHSMEEPIRFSEAEAARVFSEDAGDQPCGKGEEFRLVLIGKTGTGKSACGNTILGRERFKSVSASKSQTVQCKRKDGTRCGAKIAVVDTPGLFDTKLSNEQVIGEIGKCIGLASPGPHALLLVLKVGRFTEEERNTVQEIKKMFGDDAEKYTMVLFTHKELLNGETIDQYIEAGDDNLKKLIKECGDRYHCLENGSPANYSQIKDLMKKVQNMVSANGGSCYSNEMFQAVEAEICEIQKKTMKGKVEQFGKSGKPVTKTEWQKIYSQLLAESRKEAVTILFRDRLILAVARMRRKFRVTQEERDDAMRMAEEQGISESKALDLVVKASCQLAKDKCKIQ